MHSVLRARWYCVGAALLGAGVPLRVAAAQQPPRADFTVEAGDFYFHAPRTVPAGWTTIHLRNLGPSFHHVVLLRLLARESRDSALARVQARHGDPDVPIPGTVSTGGPEGHMPDGDSYVTVRLDPGEYLIVCMIPASDGTSHAARGMYAPLTVRLDATARRPAEAPTADLVLQMTDHSYGTSSATLAPGWRTLRVENAGPAEHIAELARLKPHRTAADLLAWMNGRLPDSLEPITTIGGSTRLAVGGRSYIRVYLVPGRYLVYCMLQSAGVPHVALGMLKELTVE